MLKDGYKEDRAIPIATKQAESWYKDATKEELEELQNKKLRYMIKMIQRILSLIIKMCMCISRKTYGKLNQKVQSKHLIVLIKRKML